VNSICHENTNAKCRVLSTQRNACGSSDDALPQAQTWKQSRHGGSSSLTTIGIGLVIPALFCLRNLAAIAQTSTQQAGNVLFVNSNVGNDTMGNGSEHAPFKTITKALQVAQSHNLIVLSSGTYSTSSGETFPLMLKPGVSIQGDPTTRGHNIAIQGGGAFLSPTSARQDITILGADQARLTGVTVTNPHPRGYGLWIESSSPVVIENTFTGNTHDGISMTGNSAPTIRSNYFYQNGANGMTIYGTSRPEVRGNVFEKTGYGINIAQQAAPVIVGNRLIQNRSGILAQADSRPILRGNVIEGSTEDGVVAIAGSQPDLGTPTQPGGNVFSQNGRYDINSRASIQTIPAFGNQLTSTRTIGSINIAGTLSPVTTAANLPPSNRLLARNSQIRGQSSTLLPSTSNNGAGSFPTPSSLVSPSMKPTPNSTATSFPFFPPQQIAAQRTTSGELPALKPAPVEVPQSTEMAPVIIDVPPPASTTPVPASSSSASDVDLSSRHPTTSTLLAPPPLQTLPVLNSALIETDLLPVPSSNIPVSHASNRLKETEHPNLRATAVSPMPFRTTSLGLRYRVVVTAPSKREQAKVRSLVPGAFITSSKGRIVMQAGIFSDRAGATQMLQLLHSKGLRATLEQLKG